MPVTVETPDLVPETVPPPATEKPDADLVTAASVEPESAPTPVAAPEPAAAPTSAAAHAEALIAAPYGDVLMHQAADDEFPLPATTDEDASPPHHDSATDESQAPTSKTQS